MLSNNNDVSYDKLDLNLITDEAPIGWSSTCLDQTLVYYLKCSESSNQNNEFLYLLNDE
uniref:Uncharacterized protein n=1 Tax=Apophlaea sinclairii TaxID=212746 RepID=A0A1C9CBJ2_9FLOR|nr:hypothetical protein Apop_052 [Apophlaea sinclairii]AOM65742.1 hypothetical protein Apop_052 [Apophlaea sinclairii]